MKRKVLSIALALVMMLTFIPVLSQPAYAADYNGAELQSRINAAIPAGGLTINLTDKVYINGGEEVTIPVGFTLRVDGELHIAGVLKNRGGLWINNNFNASTGHVIYVTNTIENYGKIDNSGGKIVNWGKIINNKDIIIFTITLIHAGDAIAVIENYGTFINNDTSSTFVGNAKSYLDNYGIFDNKVRSQLRTAGYVNNYGTFINDGLISGNDIADGVFNNYGIVDGNGTVMSRYGYIIDYKAIPVSFINGEDISTQAVETGSTVARPSDPVKDNYEFIGWYFKDALFNFNTPITTSLGLDRYQIRLVAKWKEAAPVCVHNGETYDDVTLDPTCETTGLKDVYCAGCGELLEEGITIPSLGHDYDEDYDNADYYTAPTKNADGFWTFPCSRCESVKVVTDEGTMIVFVKAEVFAAVEKLKGNQNELTITITEYYSNGTREYVTETLLIDSNSAGTYEVGGYKVFVDTKGNTQIRACYIVE